MATTVSMPQLGETVTEGTILRWASRWATPSPPMRFLVEISTDKVDTDAFACCGHDPRDPRPEGETVAVGTAMVVIGDAGEETDSGQATTEQRRPRRSSRAEPAPEEAPSDRQCPVRLPPRIRLPRMR